jgi:hypothetical protein
MPYLEKVLYSYCFYFFFLAGGRTSKGDKFQAKKEEGLNARELL